MIFMRAGNVLLVLIVFALLCFPVRAAETTCIVYFTGIGCPHCAKTDPVIFEQILKEYPDVVVIEYEIYQSRENAPLMSEYNTHYNSGFGIPLVIFNKGEHIIGDIPILQNIRSKIESMKGNPCPLIDGSSIPFESLDITSLPGKPKIWKGERVITLVGEKNLNDIMVKGLLENNLSEVFANTEFETIEPEDVALSGKSLKFDNAVKIDGWVIQWNGNPLEHADTSTEQEPEENQTKEQIDEHQNQRGSEPIQDLTIAKILSLAVVDSINPCAIAVLTLMLIAIMTYSPERKRNVLLAGISFITSVYIIYMFYGLVIIRFFQIIQALTSVRLLLYKVLGMAAIILGVLNMKDFLRYKPGGILTEMPLSLRPKVKKIISGVTSPRGAFAVGAFVSVFLLPCTIGPYIIAGGILSAIELLKTIPWLLIYNIIFVFPMVCITFLVYAGISTVENVSEWKEKNIKKLHLIAGFIMFSLGIAMVSGLV